MRAIAWPVLFVLSLYATGAARAVEPDLLQAAPPVVVATVPPPGAADVAAQTGEIRVTFSKPMQDGSWSWVKASDDSFPKLAGKPYFTADKRTCVLPVALDPGKAYAIWLNHAPHQNFQDAAGHKALDYLLVFATRP
jgi:hypothetical protein